ncbi:hypothetical protein J3A83DRAFT_3468862 [Scleroderma citrinum]
MNAGASSVTPRASLSLISLLLAPSDKVVPFRHRDMVAWMFLPSSEPASTGLSHNAGSEYRSCQGLLSFLSWSSRRPTFRPIGDDQCWKPADIRSPFSNRGLQLSFDPRPSLACVQSSQYPSPDWSGRPPNVLGGNVSLRPKPSREPAVPSGQPESPDSCQ